MRKSFILLIIIIFIISGCNNQTSSEELDANTWKLIINKEWSNLENWAGSGFYFYEEDSTPYCVFMIYGSGLPVIYHHTSQVSIQEEGVISIELPEGVKSGYLGEKEDAGLVEVKLKFEDGIIKLGESEFKTVLDGKSIEFLRRNQK